MMRKFAAALLATALIAGPAFAASSATGNDSKAPAAEQTAKPAKTVKTNHVRKHHRYVVRHRNSGQLATAHHIKRHKRHGHYMAHYTGHVAKPAKTDKTSKSNKS